jgi:hypothetical protein
MYHPIIGLVLFALVSLQPIGGILHHLGYRRTGGRTLISHIHIWMGRIIITLGIINGGLGLRIAGNATRGQQIAYGVVGGIMWLLFILIGVFLAGRGGRRATAAGAGDVKGNGVANGHDYDGPIHTNGEGLYSVPPPPPAMGRSRRFLSRRSRNVPTAAVGAAALGAGAIAADRGFGEKYGNEDMARHGNGSERPLSDDLSSLQAHNVPPTVVTSSGDTATDLHSPISPTSPEFVPAHPAAYHVTE